MAETVAVPKSADARPLDDVMLAMDVVDTLRHRAALVERELGGDDRDRQLIARLRELYASQGIEVPDNVLEEGVAALREDRFTYTPSAPGIGVSLARLYVSRRRWMPFVLALAALAAAIWLGIFLLVTLPRQRTIREIPRQVATQEDAIVRTAKAKDALTKAKELSSKSAIALREHDLPAAKRALAELQQLRSLLDQEYELRIVSQGSTGIWRVPDVNETARNYYIIVEAVAPDGRRLSVPIRNEETGRTELVNKWGLRVSQELFEQIADDKHDDGIIQNNRFGVKRRGDLEPEYLMSTTGGAITRW